MPIYLGEGLSFDDILLEPKYSEIGSRFNNQISFYQSFLPALKYPIMSANMDTITKSEMANKMWELGCLGIVHRFMSVEDQINELNKIEIGYKIPCIGTGKEQQERLDKIISNVPGIDYVLIDIAHGHSQNMINQIEYISGQYDNLKIIAGNIATYQGAIDLIRAGASILKIGVGPGCLGPGTRILMENGTYKNIEDISLHDKVINCNGVAVEVVGVKFSGFKKVYKYRNNNFYKETLVTGDHQHLCGDYSSTPNIFNDGCLSKTLDKLTHSKESKYKWSRIDEFKEKVCLLPKNIEFNIPESFNIELSNFAIANRNWKELINYPTITPSYDLGYIFGMFLGDGCSSIYKTKRNVKEKETRNTCGQLYWTLGLNEKTIAEKLSNSLNKVFGSFANTQLKYNRNTIKVYNQSNILARMFLDFGKKQEKNLPIKYWCKNIEYLKGLLDGLVDSDGTSPDKGSVDYRTSFGNTSSHLIELYIIAHKIVNKYFPSISVKPPTTGKLKNCNIDNCHESYVVRGVRDPELLLTKNYQISRIYSNIVKNEIIVPTYDIEVDCPTHSFIANNVIVHNSLCSTRVNTGCGVPQLTAIEEVKQAVKDIGKPIGIIADGGIKTAGDIIKALVFGADLIMIGNLLSGTNETPGKIYQDSNGMYKIFRGMASKSAQEDWKGFASSIEGEIKKVYLRGPVENIINELIANILSGMSYLNAKSLPELQKNVSYRKISQAGLRESVPHGLL